MVDGCIGLDETLNAISSQRAGLGRDNTCSDGIVQAERIADGQHPLADLHIVGIGNLDGRQVTPVNLDKCQVGGLVSTDDACRIFLIVCQSDSQLVSAVHHVVVCHDISVLRNDHSAAGSRALRSLHLTFLGAALTTLATTEESAERIVEEVLEGIALYFYCLNLRILYIFDMHDRRQCLISSCCEVNGLNGRCGLRLKHIQRVDVRRLWLRGSM